MLLYTFISWIINAVSQPVVNIHGLYGTRFNKQLYIWKLRFLYPHEFIISLLCSQVTASHSPSEFEKKEYYVKEKFNSVSDALKMFKDDNLCSKPGKSFIVIPKRYFITDTMPVTWTRNIWGF